MGALLTLRTELAELLAPLDLNTYTHLPGRAALPSAIVLAGSPYVESGQVFGEHFVRFEVHLSTAKGDNQSETTALDALVESAIPLLVQDGWTVESLTQPFEFDINNGAALTVAITVTAPVTFTN